MKEIISGVDPQKTFFILENEENSYSAIFPINKL
jgi:uncharacterized protein YbdZ (MbtH family)